MEGLALSDRGVYTPRVVASEGETESEMALGQRVAPAERQPVSRAELERRKAWGREWGSHAQQDAARRERES